MSSEAGKAAIRTAAPGVLRSVRLTRIAMLIPIAGAFGCNLLTGIGDLSLADGELRREGQIDGGSGERDRTDDSATDGGALDNSRQDGDTRGTKDVQESSFVDAAPYDAGAAGYTDLSGSWAGSWNEDFTIIGGGATIQLEQEGGALSGTAAVKGGVCPRTGTLSGGFVGPNEIAGTFTSDDGILILKLNSTISADGRTLKGRFSSVGACLPGAFGSTELTRQATSSR